MFDRRSLDVRRMVDGLLQVITPQTPHLVRITLRVTTVRFMWTFADTLCLKVIECKSALVDRRYRRPPRATRIPSGQIQVSRIAAESVGIMTTMTQQDVVMVAKRAVT